jgi:hypothetical protein
MFADKVLSACAAGSAATPSRHERSRPLRSGRALEAHHAEQAGVHLRDLFREDPARGERLTLEAADLYLDYSKHRVTDETIALLSRSPSARLPRADRGDVRGERINVTEDRAVLHVALRAPRDESIVVDGTTSSPTCTRSSTAWRVRRARPRRRLDGPPASRSAPSSTSASAAPTSARRWRTRRSPTSAAATDVPVRIERRRHRHRPRPTRDLEPGADAVHRLLEDVHDARDA